MSQDITIKRWHLAVAGLALAYAIFTSSVNTFGDSIRQSQKLQDEISGLAEEYTNMKALQERQESHMEYEDREITRIEIKTGVSDPPNPFVKKGAGGSKR